MRPEVYLNSHLAPISRTGFPACSTKDEFSCGAAGCPSLKDLLTMMQDVSLNRLCQVRQRM